MNIPNLYKTYNELVNYIRKKMIADSKWILGSWDQLPYNQYYHGKITRLPIEYNWKPYWGGNPSAKIVHFHGPKPYRREFFESGMASEAIQVLYDRDRENYKKMLSVWDKFYEEAP